MQRGPTMVKNNEKAAYLYIAPAILLYLVFYGFPIVISCGLMFFDYNIVSAPVFVGLDNIKSVFSNPDIGTVFLNSSKLLVLLVFSHVVLGLALALLVNASGKRMSAVMQTVIYIPTVLTTASVGVAWRFMFNTDLGAINYILSLLGLEKVPWLTSSKYALFAIVIFSIWKFVGTPFIYYFLGLQNIPQSLYEAAQIDGAGKLQIFRRITLPMLTPTIFMVLVLSFISYLQCFDEPFILTSGGPGLSTTTVNLQIYNYFNSGKMSHSSILSIVMLVIVIAITALQFKMSKKWVNYDLE